MTTRNDIPMTVERPKPSAKWRIQWTWRNHDMLLGDVIASYAADTATAYAEGQGPEHVENVSDAREVPNNITITLDKHDPIRLTRDGAAKLREALHLALDWDGR